MLNVKHILLIGASIGRGWRFMELADRLGLKGYKFEYIHGGGWEKSEKIQEVLSRSKNKPDAVVIKQCAAYFPGDMKRYKSLLEQWIGACRAAGVLPIPATVVPVTRLHALKKFGIDILKRRNPFQYGNPFSYARNRSIIEYNDWVKIFCEKQKLPCLDLESAVRYRDKNRFLRENLARFDGLHINKKAYALLDELIAPLLFQIERIGTDDTKID